MSLVAVGIFAVVTCADIGFCIFFFGCMLTVIIANYVGWDAIAGIPIPKMHPSIMTASVIICIGMAVFGSPIILAQLVK